MMKGIIFMGGSLLKRCHGLRCRCSIASPTANNTPSSNHFSLLSTRLSHSQCHPDRPCFGIAFDIDGVICLGDSPIGRSPQALRKLYHPSSGKLAIPYVFLTNGGGIRESLRAHGLSGLLGVNILQSQILQGHALFKNLLDRYRRELIIVVGKGEPAAVMSEYGFENVLSIEQYASCFSNIDPLAQYKMSMTKEPVDGNISFKKVFPRDSVYSQRVQAAFVVSDSPDWGRDIQVLCDVLRTGGLPGREIGHQPPLYFANDDLEYQSSFPSERLGMGAFRIALEAIYNRINSSALEYSSFGKPSPAVFKNAETILSQLASSLHDYNQEVNHTNAGPHNFKTLYMIGDNPSVDINGAREAGHPWFSILTRTGVFKGKENHPQFPADLVVDTVDEAVDYILRKECST